MSDEYHLFAHIPDRGTRLAFCIDGEGMTWEALDRHARAYASRLSILGIVPGDRVAYFGQSSRELVIALLGHLRSGVIHVPINTRYRGEEVRHILRDSGAKVLVSDAGSEGLRTARALASEGQGPDHRIIVGGMGDTDETSFDDMLSAQALTPSGLEPSPDAMAMIIYTSGTTGLSKGVCLSHGALTGNVSAVTELWEWSERDRLSLMLPLFHVHGLCLGILGTFVHGLECLIHTRFDEGALLDDFQRNEATIFMGVPTMYARILEYLNTHPQTAAALASGRLFTSGSAALPASHWQQFKALTGHEIVERYGMSETGFTLSNPLRGERRGGTVGLPVPGYRVQILREDGIPCEVDEPGEIAVCGDGLMSGYWGQDAATQDAYDGQWFRTGDVARRSEDGYHTILGRMSADIIKSGGFKISALEIEAVLLRHPEVREVAVLGIPDSQWGEVIAAAIVCMDSRTTIEPEPLLDRLAAHVSEVLADYKKPRMLKLLSELPRNALGKIQKHRLKPLFSSPSAD